MKLYRIHTFMKPEHQELQTGLMWANDIEEAKAAIEVDNNEYMKTHFMYRIDEIQTAAEWSLHTPINCVVINKD